MDTSADIGREENAYSSVDKQDGTRTAAAAPDDDEDDYTLGTFGFFL